jgi:hypothetical protein
MREWLLSDSAPKEEAFLGWFQRPGFTGGVELIVVRFDRKRGDYAPIDGGASGARVLRGWWPIPQTDGI